MLRFATTSVFAISMAMPAVAQNVAENDGLDDIIVTAQRRETSVQETPISITALNQAAIADSGVKRVEDLANMLPNVYIDDRNLRGQNISIRGISADLNNPGLDQGVGIFVDGVYLGRATGANTNLFDLERVEVLRGPQGTLYGKNTIAGAINYITRRPNDEAYVEAVTSYGNYDAVSGSVVASGPIIADRVFASVGGSFDQREGLIYNSYTGEHQDDRPYSYCR
jgi:iron complex outermembrane receptor protein